MTEFMVVLLTQRLKGWSFKAQLKSLIVACLLNVYFDVWSHVAQTGTELFTAQRDLELLMFLPLFSKYWWDHRNVPPCPAFVLMFF